MFRNATDRTARTPAHGLCALMFALVGALSASILGAEAAQARDASLSLPKKIVRTIDEPRGRSFASSPTAISASLGPLSRKQREHRLSHARELLGSGYRRSVVRTGEAIPKINGDVYRWARASLPAKYQSLAPKIAQTIVDEAYRHGFDPIFVLSVIQTESAFNPDAIGGVGEIGLMQIRPRTGEWIAGKAGLKWDGKKTLQDPIGNIRVGTAFLAYLRSSFDSHARLYLAAYNMGRGQVLQLRSRGKWPKEYPSKVMSAYVDYYSSLKKKQQGIDVPIVSASL